MMLKRQNSVLHIEWAANKQVIINESINYSIMAFKQGILNNNANFLVICNVFYNKMLTLFQVLIPI
jgi:hypothetical protein